MLIRRVKIARNLLGLVWVALLVLLVGLSVVTNFASRFDRHIYIVRGASMTPTIPLGSLIVARSVPANQLNLGDIVTIRGENGSIVTHRIVELRESYKGELAIRTKGDASAVADVPIRQASSVVGVIDTYVPYLGFVLAFMGMPTGLVATVAAMAALLIARWSLPQVLEQRRRGPAPVLEAAGRIPS
jgi:signal peptidase I